MRLEIGNFWCEFRKPAALEAVGFVPMFARYVDMLNEAQNLAKGDADKALINRERLVASFFRSLDEFSRKEIVKFMASLIEKWSLDEQPSAEAIEKLPPIIVLAMFDFVATITLFGDASGVNFFVDNSVQQNKKTKKD